MQIEHKHNSNIKVFFSALKFKHLNSNLNVNIQNIERWPRAVAKAPLCL